MALDQSALLEVLDALKVADVGDRVRQAAETIYQALIEAELTDTIGAALHERTDTRTNLRNGHRTRILSTTAGDLELRIPKLRTGSFFPSPAGATPPGGPGVVRGGDGGLPARRLDPQGRRPGQSIGRGHRHLQVARSRGSARTSTRRSARSATGRWPTSSSRTCSWTPPTARPGSTTASCPKRW